MNAEVLRTALALMEEYGDGTLRQLSSEGIVVLCGRNEANGHYRYKFVLNHNGELKHGIDRAQHRELGDERVSTQMYIRHVPNGYERVTVNRYRNA